MNEKLLSGQVIVITGGAGLIGRSLAIGVAKMGGTVIIADLNLHAANQLVNESQGLIEAAYLDITNKNSVVELIDSLKSKYKNIHAVVNAAYPRHANYGRSLENVEYADFCENINMHLGGYFLVSQQFCLAFVQQGFGNLVNLSSIYGSMTPRFDIYKETVMTTPVEYVAIKAAIESLTRYFAQYYKGRGLRVNALSPGGILCEQPEIFQRAYSSYCSSKGMLDADDLVGPLVFLLSEQSKFVNGRNLIVDDGFSL